MLKGQKGQTVNGLIGAVKKTGSSGSKRVPSSIQRTREEVAAQSAAGVVDFDAISRNAFLRNGL
jgi:hypothetical protein